MLTSFHKPCFMYSIPTLSPFLIIPSLYFPLPLYSQFNIIVNRPDYVSCFVRCPGLRRIRVLCWCFWSIRSRPSRWLQCLLKLRTPWPLTHTFCDCGLRKKRINLGFSLGLPPIWPLVMFPIVTLL